VIVLAVGCAALAVLLLVRPPAGFKTGSSGAGRRWVLPSVALVGLVAALAAPDLGGLALVLAGAAAGALDCPRRLRQLGSRRRFHALGRCPRRS
jgi:hypothetical protein